MTISYFDLYKVLSTSSYGSILIKKIRFSRFIPSNTSNRNWEKLLGPDVNNMKHMWWMKMVVDRFLDCSFEAGMSFSDREVHLLRLTAVIHDIAESVVGDIPKTLKTKVDEDDEKIVITDIMETLKLDHELIRNNFDDIKFCIEKIIFPIKKNRLSETFMIIEYLGYLHTAARAYHITKVMKRETELKSKLWDLFEEASSNAINKLESYQDKYPGIVVFLKMPLIREAVEMKEDLAFSFATV